MTNDQASNIANRLDAQANACANDAARFDLGTEWRWQCE